MECCYGLIAAVYPKNRSLVLLHTTKIEGTIIDLSAEITVTQRYINTTLDALDTIYRFPLDENSAISGFEAAFDGHVIKGVVKRKKVAKQIYKKAQSLGVQAALLEQNSENDFTCLVGNIPAGGSCDITTSYITNLDQEGVNNRLNLPLTIAPKYTPLASAAGDAVPATVCSDVTGHKQYTCDGCMATPLVGERWRCQECHDFDLCTACNERKVHTSDGHTLVRLDAHGERAPPSVNQELVQTMSRSLAIRLLFRKQLYAQIQTGSDHIIQRAETGAGDVQVTYEDRSCSGLEADFVVLAERTDAFVPRVRIEPGATETVVQLAFLPPAMSAVAASMTLTCELIFLLDRSGSMEASYNSSSTLSPIAALRDTMKLILRQMPRTCKFNIVSFGTRYTSLFPKSQLYTAETLKAAQEHVATLAADMGGTEIWAPLSAALREARVSTFPRQIFLLSDGGTRGVERLVNEVRAHVDTTRVFTFGIGDEVDRSMIKRLAAAGNGEAEFVSNSDDLKSKVVRQLARAFQPSLTNVTINWGCTGVQMPARVPALFPNATKRTIVYFRTEAALPSSGVFRLTAQGNVADAAHETQTWDVPYTAASIVEALDAEGPIHKLAARAAIRELEEKPEVTDSDRWAMAAIAMAHQLVSSETSFVLTKVEVKIDEGDHIRADADAKEHKAKAPQNDIDDDAAEDEEEFEMLEEDEEEQDSRIGVLRPLSSVTAGGGRGAMLQGVDGAAMLQSLQPQRMSFSLSARSTAPPGAAMTFDLDSLNGMEEKSQTLETAIDYQRGSSKKEISRRVVEVFGQVQDMGRAAKRGITGLLRGSPDTPVESVKLQKIDTQEAAFQRLLELQDVNGFFVLGYLLGEVYEFLTTVPWQNAIKCLQVVRDVMGVKVDDAVVAIIVVQHLLSTHFPARQQDEWGVVMNKSVYQIEQLGASAADTIEKLRQVLVFVDNEGPAQKDGEMLSSACVFAMVQA